MKESDWHHAPLHRYIPGVVYMVTAGTYGKEHFFRGDSRLQFLQDLLLESLEAYAWKPHAWACFSNHYHFLAMAPEEVELKRMLQGLHSKLAIAANKWDETPARKVMYQYWDRCITHDTSYYARLNYVMHNPVKHGLVEDAMDYRYCSARWFRRNNGSSFRRRVASYGYERVQEVDEF